MDARIDLLQQHAVRKPAFQASRQPRRVDAGSLGQQGGLAHEHKAHADDGLVDDLCRLAGTCRAHQRHLAAQRFQHRARPLEILRTAARHDGELAVACRLRPARHRCIHPVHTRMLARIRCQVPRGAGRDGRKIDDQLARSPFSLRNALRPPGAEVDRRIIEHAHQHHIALPGHLSRRCQRRSARSRHRGQPLGLAVRDKDRIAEIAQAQRHGLAHQAYADKTNIRKTHVRSAFSRPDCASARRYRRSRPATGR
ncbi:hypothetical protein D3C72_1425430 [compost metagenome]